MKIKAYKTPKKSSFNKKVVEKIKQGDKDFLKGLGEKVTQIGLNNLVN
jgi:hypothetical protein